MPPLSRTRPAPCGLLLPAVLTLLPAAPAAAAAPPVLANITPRGAERGRPVELTVTGANLTPGARLVLPFRADQALLPEAKPNPAQGRFRLTVDPSVPFGLYPVRLATEDGVSAPLLLGVDPFPGVAEVEDNSSFDRAQKVEPPVVITGQCPGGDVDYYRFTARQGRRVVVETETARVGSAVVPQVRVTDASRRFVAGDDTQALEGDCRVAFTAPADGDYVVEFSDARYRGGAPSHYRLKIADYDWPGEVFPLGGRRGEPVTFALRGGSLANELRLRRVPEGGDEPGLMPLALEGPLRPGALPPRVAVGDLPERTWVKGGGPDPRALDVLPPLTVNSRLERPGDRDRFQFAVQPGQRFRLAVRAAALGSDLDGVLRVTDQAGKQLALVDDVDLPPPAPGAAPIKTVDPSLDLTVPAGVSLLVAEVRDQRGRGGLNFGYRLTVEPAVPDFTVRQPVSELNVPRGGSATLAVPVTRRGYNGAVRLTVPDLPPGLALDGGHVPAGAGLGVLTVSAVDPPKVPPGPLFLGIVGEAAGEGGAVRRRAEQQLVLARDGAAAASVLPLDRFALAPAAEEPFAVQGPPAVEVVRGYPAPVPVRVSRAADQAGLAVTVSGSVPAAAAAPGQPAPPQTLLAFQPATGAGSGGAAVNLTAGPTAPDDQPFEFVVEGKARVGPAERTVTGPAVTVTVRKPFAVEILTPRLVLRPGETAALEGRLRRHPVFKEAVQIKLDGLPAGVTAAPQPVGADHTDFRIDLKADAGAAAAAGNVTLTCSAAIAGAAYSHPPVAVPVQVAAK
jgi:hypothetical protein